MQDRIVVMESAPQLLDADSLPKLLQRRAAELRDYIAPRIPPALRRIISVEDILQEVWIDTFRALDGMELRGPDALDRWLKTLAQRKLVNAIKTARRLKRGGGHVISQHAGDRTSSLVDLFVRVASPERTPSSQVAMLEATSAMQIALAELPEETRQAIWLRFIEGHPAETVATMMNKSSASVRAIVFRGLRQLHERLRRKRTA